MRELKLLGENAPRRRRGTRRSRREDLIFLMSCRSLMHLFSVFKSVVQKRESFETFTAGNLVISCKRQCQAMLIWEAARLHGFQGAFIRLCVSHGTRGKAKRLQRNMRTGSTATTEHAARLSVSQGARGKANRLLQGVIGKEFIPILLHSHFEVTQC